jgi:hypothetical protein
MYRRILLLPAMLLAVLAPLAAEPIAKIVYLAGTVEIVRDEDTLATKSVKEGFALENFDLLKTGGDGEVELLVSTPAAPATTIRVGPRTQFSLEIGKVGARQQTTIDLVAGSVALKCAKLTGGQALRVQTEGATLGVRGTSFTVSAPATGDILVTCDEGEVACTDERGGTIVAAAGEAVEQRSGKRLARLAVAAVALEQARREWQDAAAAVLKRDPIGQVRKIAWVYRVRKSQFAREFKALFKDSPLIDAWRGEDRQGRIGTLGDAQRKKLGEILVRLVRLARIRRQLERLHARLLELKDYCEAEGVTGRISLFETSTPFFARLESERMPIERELALVRVVTRLATLRNEGKLPGTSADD